MQILTINNKSYSLNDLPDTVDDNMRYAILDNNNPLDPDFYFPPLVFLESFNAPAMVLKIGDATVAIPVDWSIVVGDSMTATHLEVIPLTSLNDRGFSAFTFNPISSFRMDFTQIEMVDFYNEVTWYFPKLKTGHILALPLTTGDKPLCVFIVKDIPRTSELIHLDKLL